MICRIQETCSVEKYISWILERYHSQRNESKGDIDNSSERWLQKRKMATKHSFLRVKWPEYRCKEGGMVGLGFNFEEAFHFEEHLLCPASRYQIRRGFLRGSCASRSLIGCNSQCTFLLGRTNNSLNIGEESGNMFFVQKIYAPSQRCHFAS